VKLLPDDFGFMVGVYAFIFNTSIFLAFILLQCWNEFCTVGAGVVVCRVDCGERGCGCIER
jgi:hypothetical protein